MAVERERVVDDIREVGVVITRWGRSCVGENP